MHVSPLQQPFGHDVASQTHLPCAPHSWPEAHATQAAPASPHDIVLDVMHWPVAVQHPPAQPPFPSQEHACPVHACPVAHMAHATPPDPHAPGSVPTWHMPLGSQHPLAQLLAPHAGGPPSEASGAGAGASTMGAASGFSVVSVVTSIDASSPELSCGGGARQPATQSAEAIARIA